MKLAGHLMVASALLSACGVIGAGPAPAAAQIAEMPAENVIELWPEEVPNTPADWPEQEFHGRESITNVSTPTLTVVRPIVGTANGTAIVVAPGGGFTGLAWNLEGVEVAQWLARRGITAFILMYRVRNPQSSGEPVTPEQRQDNFSIGQELAAQDGLQAMRLLHERAADYGIDPDRIGFIGFSAGAMTAMNVVLRAEPDVRPDFVAPIYGAMPDLPIPPDAPPLFIAVAADDDILFERTLAMFSNWLEAGRAAELHVYERGGHGFGMRPKGMPVDEWPQAFAAWLCDHGWLPSPDDRPGN